jgi:hypothetical protein
MNSVEQVMVINQTVKKISLVLIAGVIFALGSTTVQALFGRSDYYGYFNNVHDDYGTDVLSGGIPSYVDSVDELVTFLWNESKSSSAQDRTGAAFIVNTMLGYNGPGKGKSVITSNGTDWADLINRLNERQSKGKIKWNVNLSESINSYYQGTSSGSNPDDDAFFNQAVNGLSIQILNDDNSNAYILRRDCANPIGQLSGLPKVSASWSISTTASADRTTATVGATITWTHVVKNNGPNPTDAGVTYHYQNRSDLGGGTGSNYTLRSGSASGTTGSFTSTYRVGASDAGKTLCRATSASPSAKGNNSWTESAPSCVSVVSSSNPCRPIAVVVPKATTYPAVSSSHGDYHTNATTVPIRVTIGDYSYGPYTTATTIDTGTVTQRYTTGDTYTVSYKETTNHVVSYTDIYVDDTSKKIYREEPVYNADGTITYKKVWTGRYEQKYSGRVKTNYSGPATLPSTSIGPCYDYKLNASFNSVDARYVESGATTDISPLINSLSYTGNYHTKSKNTYWQVTMMTIEPNVPVPSRIEAGNSTSSPCDHFDPDHVSNCVVHDSGQTIFSVSGRPYDGMDSDYTAPDVPAGTKICFAFSVHPANSEPKNYSSSWDESEPWSHAAFDPENDCMIVVKKPKIQVWGGSLWSNGSVGTSRSTKSSHTFGSWDEYSILASGNISGMASGSAFAGDGLANATVCNYSTLSFTSAGTSTCSDSTVKGGYTTNDGLTDVAASFAGSGNTITSGSVTPNDLLSGSGTYIGSRSGNLQIAGSTLAPGKTVVLKVNGTATITGNLAYNADNNGAKYNSVFQLPQLIIIANKIIINSNVTNVDAWLVANQGDGIIETCDTGSSTYDLSGNNRLTINKCNEKLTVNGPVIAKQLWLRRTAGSGTAENSGDPAEVFNLRADVYLWSAARAAGSGRIQSVYTTDLPPRF